MAWLALAVALLGLIYFSIAYEGFRRILIRVAIIGTAVIAALGLFVWGAITVDEQRRDADARVARSLVSPDQVTISDATLKLSDFSELSAIVTNNSGYEIQSLTLKVTIRDCPSLNDARKRCDVIGEASATDYGLTIPARQKRAFEAYPRFDNLPNVKEWSWSYTIGEIRAK